MVRNFLIFGYAFAGVLCFLVSGCKPETSTADSSALLSEAWRFFKTSEFSQAAIAFQIVIDRSSETDLVRSEAEFGLASTVELQRPDPDTDKARRLYETVITRSPKGIYAPWCALALARMKVYPDFNAAPDTVAGVAAYQNVIDLYPHNIVAEEAFMNQQTLIATSNEPTDLTRAVAVTRSFLEKHPGSEYTSSGWWLVATSSMALKDYLAARDGFQKCYDASLVQKQRLRNGAPAIDEASTLYAIATLSEFKLGDLETAAKAYERIIADYPRDWRTFTSRFALKRIDSIKAGVIPAVPGILHTTNSAS